MSNPTHDSPEWIAALALLPFPLEALLGLLERKGADQGGAGAGGDDVAEGKHAEGEVADPYGRPVQSRRENSGRPALRRSQLAGDPTPLTIAQS